MSKLLQRRSMASTKLSICSRQNAELGKQKWYEETYAVMEAIGHGCAGRVFRAVRKEDGKQVALKLLEAPDEQIVKARKEEFEVLQTLRHPNIVEAMEFLSGGSQALVVLNFIEGNTLDVAVKASESRCFPEMTARDLIQKLMSAVNYLHSRRVVHRDVKAQNVIISPDLTDLHLLDFNTAKSLEDGGAFTMTGTMEYASPEVLEGHSPAEKHDVWCTGLCLHMMMTGSLPHAFSSYQSVEDFERAVVNQPVKWTLPVWDQASEECKDVVRECLTVDMAFRPALLMVLRMEWFDVIVAPRQHTCHGTMDEWSTPTYQERSKTWSGDTEDLLC